MDIRNLLIQRPSKAQVLQIIDYIGQDPDRLEVVMDLFLRGEPLEQQRSAWVIYHLGPDQYKLSQAYFGQMLEGLNEASHPAVWRATMRLLYHAGFPEELEGQVITTAFDILADPKRAVAVKMFSMCILGDFCQKEPDLADELRGLIEEQLPTASAGFKSRGKKVLRQLDQLGRS